MRRWSEGEPRGESGNERGWNVIIMGGERGEDEKCEKHDRRLGDKGCSGGGFSVVRGK